MFIYEGHLGKLFVSEKQIPEEHLFGEICEDYDRKNVKPIDRTSLFSDFV